MDGLGERCPDVSGAGVLNSVRLVSDWSGCELVDMFCNKQNGEQGSKKNWVSGDYHNHAS